MRGQLGRLDPLFPAALLDQSFGQLGDPAVANRPADDIAAEDVENHLQISADPLGRPEQPCYVPGPDLVWASREQFRSLVVRVPEPDAPLPHSGCLRQDGVHSPKEELGDHSVG